jgi:hypothetical protein
MNRIHRNISLFIFSALLVLPAGCKGQSSEAPIIAQLKFGSPIKETLAIFEKGGIVSPFPPKGTYGGVGAMSILGIEGSSRLVRYSIDRPGDKILASIGGMFEPTVPVVLAGDGSEIRFGGNVQGPDFSISSTVSRLCFRKVKEGWRYISGIGEVRYKDGKLIRLGNNRTLTSCLELLSSSDPIVREGCARDLGRLSKREDHDRVLPNLSALLRDTIPSVRRGAAEGLGLLCCKDCIKQLENSFASEKDEITRKFISEALGLCAGNILIEEVVSTALSKGEAAILYSSGRTNWADELIANEIHKRNGAGRALLELLSSQNGAVRLAAVQLLGVAESAEARAALTKLSEKDPDEQVKSAAKEALDLLPKEKAK